MLLRPAAVPAARRGWLTLLTGVAVASAVRSVAEVDAVLKWPNDVLAGDRKLAGILAEQSPDGSAVVIGTGLNVAAAPGELPVSGTGLAPTSLRAEGATASREDLLLGLLHRHGVPARSTAGAPAAESMLLIGDISLDMERMTVTMAGKRVELTSRELLLLRYLAQRRGRVVTRQQLLQDVWGYQYGGDDRTVDVHVSRVRRKLPPLRAFLRAVKHVGYCLEAAEAPAVNTGTSRRIANS